MATATVKPLFVLRTNGAGVEIKTSAQVQHALAHPRSRVASGSKLLKGFALAIKGPRNPKGSSK